MRFPPPALAEQTQCAEPGCEEKQGGFAALRLVVHKFEQTRLQWGLLKMMNRWRQEAVDVRLLHELAEEVRGARLPIDH